MIVAIIGVKGMLGSDIEAEMKNRGHEVLLLDQEEPDITELSRVKEFCRRERPDVIINSSACADVEDAEENYSQDLPVNGLGSRNLTLACNEYDIDLVYISTYERYDRPALQNKYGYGKMLVEKVITALANRYYIIRTGWLSGPSGDNTTYNADLARLLGDLIKTRRYGIYHVINQKLKIISYAAERKKNINSNKEYLSIIERHKLSISPALPDQCPLVSIIIVNRNGAHHLRRLLKSINENAVYPNYEIIIVDNASEDDSIEFLESNRFKFSIRIIKNKYNETFSRANNQAAEIAGGDFLLFLNNDTDPLYGWLNELMKCALSNLSNLGSIGAKLIYPDKKETSLSYKIQHIGIAFKREKGFIRPYNMGRGLDPFNKFSNQTAERGALTAATLLIARKRFFEAGGFDEKFNYGYEDVDLSLKLYAKGYKNIYCPTSVLFHYESATQDNDAREIIIKRLMENMDILQKRWYTWLKKELFFDKIDARKVFSEKPLKVAIAVTGTGLNATAGDPTFELGSALTELGWEVIFLARKGPANWYEFDDNVDVLISLAEEYDLSKIRANPPFLIKIAWMYNRFEKWVELKYFSQYDIILASSQLACKYIKKNSNKDAILLHRYQDGAKIIKEVLKQFYKPCP